MPLVRSLNKEEQFEAKALAGLWVRRADPGIHDAGPARKLLLPIAQHLVAERVDGEAHLRERLGTLFGLQVALRKGLILVGAAAFTFGVLNFLLLLLLLKP